MPIYFANCRRSTPEELRREWWINFWTVAIFVGYVFALLLHSALTDSRPTRTKAESNKITYEEPKWETWRETKGPIPGLPGQPPLR